MDDFDLEQSDDFATEWEELQLAKQDYLNYLWDRLMAKNIAIFRNMINKWKRQNGFIPSFINVDAQKLFDFVYKKNK